MNPSDEICPGPCPHAVPAAHWEHFAHGSDIGIRGVGPGIEEAFEQAAVALTDVVTDSTKVDVRDEVGIRCEDGDPALLLVDWLNALICEMGCRRMLFGRFEVSIRDGVLEGRAWGEEIDPARHLPAVEVKGATYTQLRVGRETDGSWVAQCVVDV